jgi:hypothetical protein
MFTELLGTDYEFVNRSSDCHLNYSREFGGKMHIIPHGLLSEVDIRNDIDIYFEKSNNQWFALRTSDGEKMSFDVFSSSFYLVSRYEEYLSYEPDDHNRYTAGFSCLSQHDLLMEPLVNQWAFYIKNELSKIDSSLEFSSRKFEYLSTVDVDQAWKFKHKGAKRNILGTFRDLKEGKWENFRNRWPILLGLKKDPFYEAFHWHKSQEIKYGIKPNYFVLVGDYGTFDKNTAYENMEFQQLIKSLDEENSLGIHPSYQSNIEIDRVAAETNRLSDILDRPISKSRQHFLMHTMPATYRLLLELGIKEDHTMGYSTHLGFRAGIAAPFYWFDLETNEQTELRLMPFCAMDITPLHYRGESPSEATETIHELMLKVHEVGGLFVSLWHNESFSETERWIGWSSVYEGILANAHELKP